MNCDVVFCWCFFLSTAGTAVYLPAPANNLFKHLQKLCRLCFLVLLLLLLCVEVDFSESKSSKTIWKHLILHQEHKDFSIGIKDKSLLAVVSSKTGTPFLRGFLCLLGCLRAPWGSSAAAGNQHCCGPTIFLQHQGDSWNCGFCLGNIPGCTSPSHQCDSVWGSKSRVNEH